MTQFPVSSTAAYTKQQPYWPLHLLEAGYIRAPRPWRHKRRFLEAYELLYVTTGRLHLRANAREWTLEAGQALLLPPYQRLDGSRESESDVAFYWADFQSGENERLPPAGQPFVPAPERLSRLLEELCAAKRQIPVQNAVQDALLLLALREVTAGVTAGSRTVLERVTAYVEAHLSEPLTADDVAAALHYHKDYLTRVMREHTGLPLKEYINRRKLETACVLLRTSAYPVSVIAGMLGYDDANLFTKFFRYHRQLTPTQYRASVG